MQFQLARFLRATSFGSNDPVAIRGARHLVAGGTGTVLYIVIVATLIEVAGVRPVPAALSSYLCLAVYTYLVSRSWVFQSNAAHQRVAPKFFVVTLVSLLLNVGIMYLVVDITHNWYGWGLLLSLLIIPATNFMLNYAWVFR